MGILDAHQPGDAHSGEGEGGLRASGETVRERFSARELQNMTSAGCLDIMTQSPFFAADGVILCVFFGTPVCGCHACLPSWQRF